ncbi:LysR family transcriptional regulator [Pararhodobacter sp.]
MTSPAPPLSAIELRAIHALTEHRRSAEAAAALAMSQPSLSRHVAAAEARLGIALFRRGWSGSDTTAAGDIVARQCQRILGLLDALDAALSRPGAPCKLGSFARWRHLRVTAHVAQSRSASASAAALGMRQPAISQTLRQAADFAGQPLFLRRSAGLEPTQAALRAAATWAEVEAALGALPGLLTRPPGALDGRVAVGMLPFSGQNLVLDAFADLTHSHPDLRLMAIPGSYAMLTQALLKGEIDVILGSLRCPAPDPALTEERLYDEHFTMIARRDHPVHAGPMTLPALARESWSVAPHGTPVRRYFEALFRGVPEPPRTQSVEIFSFANAEQMILTSETIALLCYNPERLAALHPGLRPLAIPLPDARVPVGVTRVAGRPLPEAVRAFLDRLTARIAAKGLA